MNEIDIQREWRKFAEAYAGMGDEELDSLAGQAYELTDLAKEALQAEIKTRGMKVVWAETPPTQPEPDENGPRGDLDPGELNLLPVTRVWDATSARDTMKTLYEAGILAYLGPENVEEVNQFHGDFESGVDVRVREVDGQRARAALAKAARETRDDVATQEQYIARCPKCHSEEIVFEELVPAAGTTESAQGEKFRWRCDTCGHEWEDDGVEETQTTS